MVYRPTARVLTVLELLQAHGRMTGAELAERLEVNIRTVRDYIEMLLDLGIPVEAIRGRYGAYRLKPGYKLPPLIFTEDESLALTLSLLLAKERGLAAATPAFEGVLAKVMRVLPEKTRAQVQAVEQTVVFEEIRTTPQAPSALTVSLLSLASQKGQCVRLRYQTERAQESERVFDPYGVVSHAGVWYTIGYCHLRQGQRLFRLDRIQQLEMVDETFIQPTDFHPLAEVQRALASVPRAWSVEVWFETSLKEITSQIRLASAYFTPEQHGVLLRFDVADLPWAARFLAGLGIPFVIHQPDELRAVLRDYALFLAHTAKQISAQQAPETREADHDHA